MELYAQNESYYSQRAILALNAKGVDYRIKLMDMNEFDHLQPWYLRINPAGLIPTLKHGDKYIADSSAIITYLDEACDGPKLLPDVSSELGKKVKSLYDKIEGLNIRMLTLTTMTNPDMLKEIKVSEKLKEMAGKHHIVSGRNIEALEKLLTENPDLKDIYSEKLQRAKQFNPRAVFTKENRSEEVKRTTTLLKEVEEILSKRESENEGRVSWLFGPDITAADVALVILLQRLSNLGLSKEMWMGKLIKLEGYFEHAKDNFPGYKEVAAKGF